MKYFDLRITLVPAVVFLIVPIFYFVPSLVSDAAGVNQSILAGINGTGVNGLA